MVSTNRRHGVNASAAIKVPCDYATTANITLSGEQTIDGNTTSESRVLVKDQTDASENGIYDTASGAWTRAPDFDGNFDIVGGTIIPVHQGTANADTYWRITNTGTITIGTTDLTIAATTVLSSAILNDGSVKMIADFVPNAHNSYDLGENSTPLRWRDLWLERNADIDGTLNVEGAVTFQSSAVIAGTIAGSSNATITGTITGSSDATISGTITGSSDVVLSSLTTSISGVDPALEGQLWTSSGYVLVSTG